MSSGGKGSARRPMKIDKKTFDNNWDLIFKKKERIVDDYQDILSTEDCMLNVLEALSKEPNK